MQDIDAFRVVWGGRRHEANGMQAQQDVELTCCTHKRFGHGRHSHPPPIWRVRMWPTPLLRSIGAGIGIEWLGPIGLNELPAWPGREKVEVAWELHPSVWGQGLATEGGRAAVRYGFEVVGLDRIISTARADNAASRRVMEKCGLAFQEEFLYKGALAVWYAIDRADWQAS